MFTKGNISGQNAEDSSSSVPVSQDAGPRQTARKSALAENLIKNPELQEWKSNFRCSNGVDEFNKRYLIVQKRKSKLSSKWRTVATLPFSSLVDNPGELFKRLTNEGLFIHKKAIQNLIMETVQAVNAAPIKYRVITRSGWHGVSYVIPGQVFSPKGSEEKFYVHLSDASQDFIDKFRPSGTLEGWLEEISRLCQGNTRLMLGVSLALVQALLDLVSAELGGFLLYGAPGQGKTTAIHTFGSVAGGLPARTTGYCETWNHTGNHVEEIAALHDGVPLALDETRTAGEGSKNMTSFMASTVMRLSMGIGKGRMTDANGPKLWRLIYLGTTNLTVDQILTGGGLMVDDAYRVRAIDIPLPENGHGIFENLHGFESGAALSNHLKEACNRQYGTLFPAFLQRLVQARADDEAGLKRQLNRWRQRYIRRANKVVGNAPGMERFHERFATVYLGARLAIKFELLPWTWRELREAILTCEQDHFRLRGESARRDGDGLAALKTYVSGQRGQMIELQPGKAHRLSKLTQAPGFLWTEAGDSIVGLDRDQLVSLCGGKSAADRVLKLLHQQGALVSERKGDPLKAQQKQIITKKGEKQFRPHLYMIKADTLK